MSGMNSHRRKNLLTGEWVLVSPHRNQRPWQGRTDNAATPVTRKYDPECYLCPGNARAGEELNPKYEGCWSFENDFPALTGSLDHDEPGDGLFVSAPVGGRCRVICFSHQHDRHISQMSVEELQDVLRFMSDEHHALDSLEGIAYTQVFENRGEMMGCSNPHPHAQVWATSELPNEVSAELECQQDWYSRHGSSLLLDYVAGELASGERIVSSNATALSVVPYWATWPFETLLIPAQPVQGFADMSDEQWYGFARVLKDTVTAYDALFDTPMPYSMGFHPRPGDHRDHPEWQFHAHMYPPLLRSATVRKYMVGFEMLGMPQRDLTPETAARQLRAALNGTNL